MAGQEWLEKEEDEEEEEEEELGIRRRLNKQKNSTKKYVQRECSGPFIKLLRKHFHKSGYCSFIYFVFYILFILVGIALVSQWLHLQNVLQAVSIRNPVQFKRKAGQ